VNGATLANKATKPGTGWYGILGYMPIFSAPPLDCTAPRVARFLPKLDFEFEQLHATSSPEISALLRALTPKANPFFRLAHLGDLKPSPTEKKTDHISPIQWHDLT
jgi:hypothetical protein